MLRKAFKSFVKCYDAAINFLFFLPCGGETSFRKKCVTFASLQDGDRVLDLCCGAGEMTMVIARQAVAIDLVGVDISGPEIEIASVTVRSGLVTFLRASAAELPFKSSSFDKCFISFGLHHMSESMRRKTLKEVHHSLAPEGVLYVIDYNLPESRIGQLCAMFYIKFDTSSEVAGMLKGGRMVDEIKQTGFGISQRIPICQGLVQLIKVAKPPSLLRTS